MPDLTEKQFRLALVVIAATVLCILIMATSVYYTKKARMIAESADPVATKCALGGTRYEESIACIVVAGRRP
jgi:hypothetical protein